MDFRSVRFGKTRPRQTVTTVSVTLANIFDADADAGDVATAVSDDGYAVIHGALDGEALGALKSDLQPYLDAAHSGHDPFMGSLTKRFGALISKSTAVQQLIMDPTVLTVANQTLLPSCARYHVHYTGVMHLEPGETQQILHRDTSIYPIANPCPPLTLATMWALNDFTRDNGGTRIAPGSHRWDNDRVPTRDDIVATEMPAGSVLIYIGNVVHGGGSNRSTRPRTGVALHYALGWLRQEENQYLAVSHEQARSLPDELQELMGYALGSSNLGFVDHVAPKDYLHGVRDPAESELSPDGLSDRVNALERFHVSHTARGRPRHYDVVTD